ncbi:MAG: tetratricopeptide repeat protein [Gelidibacter sp.]
MATIGKDKRVLAETYNMMGYVYAQASLPDSGLVYTQKAMAVASESDSKDMLRYIYDTTADNYIANKDYDLAIPFLRKSLRLFLKDPTYDTSIGYVYNNLSESFLGAKMYDSSYYYAQKSIAFCKPIDMKDQLLESYEFVYKIF